MASTQAPASTYSVQIGPQARVTLNNGTGATSVNGTGRLPRQVIVTPLSSAASNTVRSQSQVSPPISKALIKAVKSDGKKADGKTFTLRSIDPSKVKTCDHLKL